MASITLIGSNRILNQAIRLFLFPQHDVRVRSDLANLDLQELQTSHLTIVDLSHVADPETITGVTRTVSKLKMPILWLAGEGAPGCPDGEHFHSMLLPVEREILQEVLNQLLANTAEGGKERGDHQPGSRAEKNRPKRGAKRKAAEPETVPDQFIELVDIVEEEATGMPGPQQPK